MVRPRGSAGRDGDLDELRGAPVDEIGIPGRRAGRLLLLCGLPGSGKTTLAVRLADELDAIRLGGDDWMIDLGIDLWDQAFRGRVEVLQWRVAQRLLAVGTNVVIEWGVWSRAERDVIRHSARELGAAVELRVLVEPVDELWQRIVRRQLEGRWGARPIRRDELEQWAEVIEYPDDAELALFDRPPGWPGGLRHPRRDMLRQR